MAEQVSFGPTPALVAELRAGGLAAWIDRQVALPPSLLDAEPFSNFETQPGDDDWSRYRALFPNLAVGGADQLRLRVTWALSQVIVTSDRKGDLVGTIHWINLLQKHALGNYGTLLREVTINPTMGNFLGNIQNRPKSTQCQYCAPNENYARELMQLFSVGVVKLADDGTPLRGADGQPIETYTQRDVEEMARALTGWTWDPEPANRPNRNWANWAKPMVPSPWAHERDTGQKVIMGRTLPANQSAAQDLDAVVNLLMNHPNTAPFVATRLIQHLVKSTPSPDYVRRVAQVCRNNGSGVLWDLKAVVRAILLDSEARRGDVSGQAGAQDGKIKEPFLMHMALWRGLGCQTVPRRGRWVPLPQNQVPFNAESVFSFYAPTDRAPGSNLLAPEQRLLTAAELSQRLSVASGLWWDGADANGGNTRPYTTAQCEIAAMVAAYERSPNDFSNWVSDRFFRGAMPHTLRANIEGLIARPQWDVRQSAQGALRMLDYALTTPHFGVHK